MTIEQGNTPLFRGEGEFGRFSVWVSASELDLYRGWNKSGYPLESFSRERLVPLEHAVALGTKLVSQRTGIFIVDGRGNRYAGPFESERAAEEWWTRRDETELGSDLARGYKLHVYLTC